jgi:alanine dehydrogenase
MIEGALLVSRHQVAGLLQLNECMAAVENAFRLYAEGKVQPPGILGVHVANGGFHIKAGAMKLSRNYFVAKTNANFPGNHAIGLPTIQGVIVVFDADNGKLLCVMDSIEISIIRTGAATGVAAKYLSRKDAKVATICGCGNQGKISLNALMQVRAIEKVFVFDIDQQRAEKFANEMSAQFRIEIIVGDNLSRAVSQSDIGVTCTPSQKPLIMKDWVKPGTFISAVGTDSDTKQEIDPHLVASSKLVTDLTSQSATIGDLHHAIDLGLMKPSNVHAELGEVIAGKKEGRVAENEIILFDSTGIALQDVAAATIVYEKAIASNSVRFDFGKM